MKKIIFILALLLPVAVSAQEATETENTVFVNGQKIVVKRTDNKIKVKVYEEVAQGDTIENAQVFEGVYLNGQSTEQRFTIAVPFVKKKNKYSFEPHAAGLYLGYSSLYGNRSFGDANNLSLNASRSWEIGINLFEGSLALTRDRHWAITTALGWGYTSYRLDSNSAFQEIDGVTVNVPAPDGATFDKSRLRYNFLRLPIAIEWQQRVNGHGPIFLSAGAEVEWRYGIKSKAKVNGDSKTIDSGLNARPLGINLLVQGGFSNIGAYARYATSSMFEKNKGPELYPFSFGIFWYW